MEIARRQHRLKTWREYYAAVISGEKTFEVRLDDRHYEVGDELHLFDFDQTSDGVSFHGSCLCDVTYVLKGGQFGIEQGYVVMGIKLTKIIA